MSVRTWRAPGRINLIGEHTDYNLGLVCPMAIDRDCHVTAEPSHDGVLRILSRQFEGDGRECPVDELLEAESTGHWTDYSFGVARELLQAGHEIAPVTLTIDSHVPTGAGLSSSAALEVSTALALLDGREMNPLHLAQLCQRAETDFVGMPCGIMDQYISVFGGILSIDCRDLSARDVALPEGVVVIAVNSGVKHALAAGSAYAERVKECLRAAEQAGVESLRDAQLGQIQFSNRARHVVGENQRVLDFVEAAQRRDVREMGRLFTASHRSLQHDYEVSCDELDFLVDSALNLPGVYGARMTGAGFGGCTVNLVRAELADQFSHAIARLYHDQYQREAAVFPCWPAQGAGAL
jgi:galactokinase